MNQYRHSQEIYPMHNTHVPNTNPKLRIVYVRVGEDYPETVTGDGARTYPIVAWRINPGNQAEPIPLAGLSLSDPDTKWAVVENDLRVLEAGTSQSLRRWYEEAARWLIAKE